MSDKRYPDEFKIDAVRQIVERGHEVAQVAKRLGVSTHSLYAWKKQFAPAAPGHQAKAAEQAEIKRLQKELKRVTGERDILIKPRRTSTTSPSEVCLYQDPPRRLAGASSVSPTRVTPRWLLRRVS